MLIMQAPALTFIVSEVGRNRQTTDRGAGFTRYGCSGVKRHLVTWIERQHCRRRFERESRQCGLLCRPTPGPGAVCTSNGPACFWLLGARSSARGASCTRSEGSGASSAAWRSEIAGGQSSLCGARDEIRHARVISQLAHEFGETVDPVRIEAVASGPRDRRTRNATEGCVRETLVRS